VRRVIVESPYKGATPQELGRNILYLRACLRDCLLRGEAPYASHAIYTQDGVLDDDNPDERDLGIRAGFEWRQSAEVTVVYTDLGISKGMQIGIDDARRRSCDVIYRSLPGWGPERSGEITVP